MALHYHFLIARLCLAVSCNYQSVQSAWHCIKQGAKSPAYMALQKAVETGESSTEVAQYKTLLHRLSIRRIEDVDMVVLDSTRLVIPTNSQKTVLTELHRAHSGVTKTYATAIQLYYWPGMKNCIRTFLSKCPTCQKFSASQARTPVKGTAPSAALFPMNNLGMDLFDAAGKKWLAVVCRFSGYAWLSLLNKTTTAYILQTLDSLFTEYGFPSVIRSDGGPQFRSEFDEYCRKNSIKHELSSPYNPESNGLAESAVKNLKSIILRCEDSGEDIKTSIAVELNGRKKMTEAEEFLGLKIVFVGKSSSQSHFSWEIAHGGKILLNFSQVRNKMIM